MTAPTDAPRRDLVLVVGVGRSGTSLCAGILARLGYHAPQPEMAADDTNPRGFSEPRWVVEFHRRLMRQANLGVFDSRPKARQAAARFASDRAVREELEAWLRVQLVGADRVVVKDPRLTWFLPLWQQSAAELGLTVSTVTMLRPTPEVLDSAKRSYGTWQSDASRAVSWINGMLGAEQDTRGLPRRLVRYDRLLADWRAEIAEVGRRIDVPDLVEVSAERGGAVDELVDPTLHRSKVAWSDLEVPDRVVQLSDRVWSALVDLADGDERPSELDRVDALRAEYDELYREAEAIAQSSISPVKPAKAAKTAQPAKKGTGSAAASADGASGPAAAGRQVVAAVRRAPRSPRLRGARRFAGKVVRRLLLLVPREHRGRLPLRLRRVLVPNAGDQAARRP